uniref:Uncharacterized protein n=1 Tax=Nelumbo nucifera TaxID=4432 RepID=A0A822XN31_NELNU|nr:TPA_asm: hypothetical protein HUJ06_023263 [Nelumbo nucifera]
MEVSNRILINGWLMEVFSDN